MLRNRSAPSAAISPVDSGTNPPPPVRRGSRWAVALIAALLLAHALLAFDSARRLSVTHDEFWHLPIGLLIWKTGRFDYDVLNPPLVRLWSAVPLLWGGVQTGAVELHDDPADYGDAFLAANADKYELWFTWGRCAIVFVSLATGVLIAFWSYELAGARAACLTALLWTTSPNVIANAALVTGDLGAAFCFVSTLYALWRFARRPTWRRALIFGVCLGLAQLAKYTCLLLYPLAIFLWVVLRWGKPKATPDTGRWMLLKWIGALALSGVLLNAGYLFQQTALPLGAYLPFQSRGLATVGQLLPRWFPVPLPRDYLRGLDKQQHIFESAHPIYLDGVWNTSGFADYYLKTLLYKVPHAEQLLVLLTAVFLIVPSKVPRRLREQLCLLLPIACLLTIASCSSMQLGLRYILPVLPLAMIFAGQAAQWVNWRSYPLRTIAVALLAAALPLSLRYHPQHLAYFNELAGGPAAGRFHLLDSNLDWGQDLGALRRYLAAHPVDRLGLAYFGTFPPHAMGIDYELPPARAPQPGWYAVSANFVQGRPHAVRDRTGLRHQVGINEYAYFRFFEPVARIGYSIDVYHLTSDDVRCWQFEMRRLGR